MLYMKYKTFSMITNDTVIRVSSTSGGGGHRWGWPLRSLLFFMPKEAMACQSPIWYDIDYKLYSAAFKDYMLQSVSYQQKDLRASARLTFFSQNNSRDPEE